MDDQYSHCLKIYHCMTNCYNYLLVVTSLTDGQDGETNLQSPHSNSKRDLDTLMKFKETAILFGHMIEIAKTITPSE